MTTIEDIDAWASVLTGENRSGKEYYYVTEPVKRLEWKLKHLKGQLIALIGLQGTGKSSALSYIGRIFYNEEKRASSAVYVKWTENCLKNLPLVDDGCYSFISDRIVNEIELEFEVYSERRKKHPLLNCVPNSKHIDESYILSLLTEVESYKILGKGKVNEITQEGIIDYLNSHDIILIDLPDYTKTDRRLMTKNLSEIQELWEKLHRDKNIVTGIQKELFSGHFFFGKMDVIELHPLKPEEFVHVFKTQFSNCDLITDKALVLLGQLSRGVFRRFLKYLSLTLESFAISEKKPPIGVHDVDKAVSVEQLIEDMELELYDVFKNGYQRRQAVELLYHLREHGQVNQKDIAEFLNVSMTTAGKMVSKLYTYGYVTKKRGTGREWIISLKV